MNSFRTRADSLAVLGALPRPRRRPAARLPAAQGAAHPRRGPRTGRVAGGPEHEWCPPGHGDIYAALVRPRACSTRCSSAASEYAFVSNSDNLGAVARPRHPRLVRERARALRDGGARPHRGRQEGRPPRARAKGGGLAAARVAQCPTDELETLPGHRAATATSTPTTSGSTCDALARRAARARRRARAADDPQREDRRSRTTRRRRQVIQLETAMGAAIAVFDGRARRCASPRDRFVPVKTTSDLLALWSDALRARPTTSASWRRRGARGATSSSTSTRVLPPRGRARRALSGRRAVARRLHALRVAGDVRFGAGVVCRGEVAVRGGERSSVADGAVLTGPVEVAAGTSFS